MAQGPYGGEFKVVCSYFVCLKSDSRGRGGEYVKQFRVKKDYFERKTDIIQMNIVILKRVW